MTVSRGERPFALIGEQKLAPNNKGNKLFRG